MEWEMRLNSTQNGRFQICNISLARISMSLESGKFFCACFFPFCFSVLLNIKTFQGLVMLYWVLKFRFNRIASWNYSNHPFKVRIYTMIIWACRSRKKGSQFDVINVDVSTIVLLSMEIKDEDKEISDTKLWTREKKTSISATLDRNFAHRLLIISHQFQQNTNHCCRYCLVPRIWSETLSVDSKKMMRKRMSMKEAYGKLEMFCRRQKFSGKKVQYIRDSIIIVWWGSSIFYEIIWDFDESGNYFPSSHIWLIILVPT